MAPGVRLIRRRPDLLPLQLPRLDGSTWPGIGAVGRGSFDVSTLHEMGYREAFEPAANGIAQLLVQEVLPVIVVGDAAPEDDAYLRRTFQVAAQVGAGIGIVDARGTASEAAYTDRRIWGALWQGLRELPALAPRDRFVAAYMMQSGHYVARTGIESITALLSALDGDLGHARR